MKKNFGSKYFLSRTEPARPSDKLKREEQQHERPNHDDKVDSYWLIPMSILKGKSSEQLLGLVKQIVPPLYGHFYKGQGESMAILVVVWKH